MIKTHTPGVYVEELPSSPPSVAEVSTAIPAFLGYTAIQPHPIDGVSVRRITSMLHFQKTFGGPAVPETTVDIKWSMQDKKKEVESLDVKPDPIDFKLYYAIKHYFHNGGGPCYIISVGTYSKQKPQPDAFNNGLAALAKEDEPTLIVLTDAACGMEGDAEAYYGLVTKALKDCKDLQDRFTIVDVLPVEKSDVLNTVQDFRDRFSGNFLEYGAAYYPWLKTSLPIEFEDKKVTVNEVDMPPNHWEVEVDGLAFSSKAQDSKVSICLNPNLSEKLQPQFNGNELILELKVPLSPAEIVQEFEAWNEKNSGKAGENGFFLKKGEGDFKGKLPKAEAIELTPKERHHYRLTLGENNKGLVFSAEENGWAVELVEEEASGTKKAGDSDEPKDTGSEPAGLRIELTDQNIKISGPKTQLVANAIVSACHENVEFAKSPVTVTQLGDGTAPIAVAAARKLEEEPSNLPFEVSLGGVQGLIASYQKPGGKLLFSKGDLNVSLEGNILTFQAQNDTAVTDILKKFKEEIKNNAWALMQRGDGSATFESLIPKNEPKYTAATLWTANLGAVILYSQIEPVAGDIALADGIKLKVDQEKKISFEGQVTAELLQKHNWSSTLLKGLWVAGSGKGEVKAGSQFNRVEGQTFSYGCETEMKAWAPDNTLSMDLGIGGEWALAADPQGNTLKVTVVAKTKLVDLVKKFNQEPLETRKSTVLIPTTKDLDLEAKVFLPGVALDQQQKPGTVSELPLGTGLVLETREKGLKVEVVEPKEGKATIAVNEDKKRLTIAMAGKNSQAVQEQFQKSEWAQLCSLHVTDKAIPVPVMPLRSVQPSFGLPYEAQLGVGNGFRVEKSNGNGSLMLEISDGAKGIKFLEDGDLLTVTCPKGSLAKDITTAFFKEKKQGKEHWSFFQLGDGSKAFSSLEMRPIEVDQGTGGSKRKAKLDEIRFLFTGLYNQIKARLSKIYVTLPPSAAIAGIYASVDRTRGVWKAPANISIASISHPLHKINDAIQSQLNIDATSGKSVNAIRFFPGKGNLVWGARTLAGNDNNWRYISVRRFVIMVEESIRKATAFAVFEPNTSETWLKVSSMIDSFLYNMFQQGALAGAKQEEAFYVHVGLGITMNEQDIREGKMIVEIGLAVVRPAEFIVLRFSQKLEEA